jgi:hypothetical protein
MTKQLGVFEVIAKSGYHTLVLAENEKRARHLFKTDKSHYLYHEEIIGVIHLSEQECDSTKIYSPYDETDFGTISDAIKGADAPCVFGCNSPF